MIADEEFESSKKLARWFSAFIALLMVFVGIGGLYAGNYASAVLLLYPLILWLRNGARFKGMFDRGFAKRWHSSAPTSLLVVVALLIAAVILGVYFLG